MVIPGTEKPMTMEEVLRRENLMAAYRRVKSNGGSPGVDGMPVDALGSYLVHHWEAVREALRTGTYRPQAVRLVEIAKPSGRGVRRLGIPTVLDRLIQQAILQVLQPHFDATFSDSSFGFRPGRGAHQAVEQARGHVRAGYRWVVDLDLEAFFDRVNHDVLMSRLARRIEDKQLLRLLRRYLQAGLFEGGLVSQRVQGTPQGGPLSPLLSNALLDELDRELERRGHRFVRYADDVNVYVASRRAGERVMASLESFLWKRLRLPVNREKSAVGRPWKRKYLGYSMTHHVQTKLRVAPESARRFREKTRELLRRGRGRSLRRTLQALEPLLRGWVQYFRLAETKNVFEDLDQWLRRRLRCLVWRQWKRPWTRSKKLVSHRVPPETARASAYNGRGPWWNSRSSHLHRALPARYFHRLGLVSLLQTHRRLACPIRTAVYGTVRTVV
jgi:group II intron reverse transcriptase/maturase